MKLLIGNIDKKSLFLFIIVTFLLQLSFNYNFFNAASNDFFQSHQKDSEALVIGKIIDSKNNNIFNEQVLGTYPGTVEQNYDIYINGNTPDKKISQYHSSFGFQGYFYSLINKIISVFDLSSKNKLDIMYFLTSLLMSLTLTIFISLVKKEFGIFSAIILLIGILYSQWLVVFARNLYWMIFFLFLPFVFIWYTLKKEENNIFGNLSKSFYGFVFLIIYLKSLAGFEYLSTIFISIAIPFFYFYFKNNWKFKELIKRLLFVYCSAFIAFIASIITFLLQKYLIVGSFSNALIILKTIILKRTYGNPDEMNQVYRESLESNVGEVILKYWDGKAIDLQSIFGKFTFVTFGEIISLFLFIVLIFIILNLRNQLKSVFNIEQKSLLYVTLISSLAPLSWHILAKAHSYVHTHMNNILWYSPFLLLIFVFIGLTISRLKISFKNIFLISILFLTIYFFYSNNKKISNIMLLNSNIISIANPENNMNIFINTKEKKLIYFYKDCKDKDITSRFFLHIVPKDINNLLEFGKKEGFNNLDFDWQTFSISTPFYGDYSNSCLAAINLPKYSINKIYTGQFNNLNRIWQINIDLNSKIEPLKETQSFNLTDANWKNGISLSQTGFFIDNNFLNRQSLKIGNKISFSSSGKRNIINLIYSDGYINIFVDGEKLDPIKDGYPNKIKIIEQE